MAAPPDVNMLNLAGEWVMNKSLSTNGELVLMLKHQGVDWWIRKLMGSVTFNVTAKMYRDEIGVEHIVCDQWVAFSAIGTSEHRILDWEPRSHQDMIFGSVIGSSRRVQLVDIEDEFLKRDWLPECAEHGLVETHAASDTVKSKKTWEVDQVFGFQEIKGERRHVRHCLLVGLKGERVEVVLVFDYVGPLKARDNPIYV